MSDSDDIKQPLDHLPPKERDDGTVEPQAPEYPDTGKPAAGESPASPETAAEPDKPARHGVAKLPPS